MEIKDIIVCMYVCMYEIMMYIFVATNQITVISFLKKKIILLFYVPLNLSLIVQLVFHFVSFHRQLVLHQLFSQPLFVLSFYR